MKTNAIVRIVIFSIVIMLLMAILVGGLLIGKLAGSGFFEGLNNELPFRGMEDGTISSSGYADPAQIHNIEIDWAAGAIIIQPGDTKTITFSETGAKDDDDVMIWKQEGDTLVIQYSKGEIKWGGLNFGITADISKDLTITVPEGWLCHELELNSAATELRVSNLTISEVDVNNAAGYNAFINCAVTDLTVETVSADISFVGTLSTLECEAVSANCTFHLDNVPKRIDMEGVSGDLKLNLPENAGFTATLETVSGDFSSEFATISQNGKYIAGDGSCKISISGVSGDIEINKN